MILSFSYDRKKAAGGDPVSKRDHTGAPRFVPNNGNMVNENPIAIGFIFRQPLKLFLSGGF